MDSVARAHTTWLSFPVSTDEEPGTLGAAGNMASSHDPGFQGSDVSEHTSGAEPIWAPSKPVLTLPAESGLTSGPRALLSQGQGCQLGDGHLRLSGGPESWGLEQEAAAD